MHYYVMEIQKDAEGHFAHIVTEANTYSEAESTYCDKRRYAAISTLPVHTVMWFDSHGAVYEEKTYDRETPAGQAEA